VRNGAQQIARQRGSTCAIKAPITAGGTAADVRRLDRVQPGVAGGHPEAAFAIRVQELVVDGAGQHRREAREAPTIVPLRQSALEQRGHDVAEHRAVELAQLEVAAARQVRKHVGADAQEVRVRRAALGAGDGDLISRSSPSLTRPTTQPTGRSSRGATPAAVVWA
jgi:hypothetical protein